MRTWGLATLALACALLSGCSGGVPAPRAVPTPSRTASPVSAATDVPAQQVLALVPRAATVLTVTDFARIRDQLGDDGHDGDAVWERADESAPLLSRGMWREPDRSGGQLRQADVAWEAHFTGGAEGYVVRLADDTDLTVLHPPRGAELRPADHLVVSGVAPDPGASWAAVPGIAELVPDQAESAYVQRGCLAGDATPDLEQLDAYSVEFGSTVATARLGPGRRDLFARMRLGAASPGFAAAFADGAADPSSGRIGYRLVDPVKAVDLTLRQRLPFAVCGS